MNEGSHKILVVLIFNMVVHRVLARVVSLHWVLIGQHWSGFNFQCGCGSSPCTSSLLALGSYLDNIGVA